MSENPGDAGGLPPVAQVSTPPGAGLVLPTDHVQLRRMLSGSPGVVSPGAVFHGRGSVRTALGCPLASPSRVRFRGVPGNRLLLFLIFIFVSYLGFNLFLDVFLIFVFFLVSPLSPPTTARYHAPLISSPVSRPYHRGPAIPPRPYYRGPSPPRVTQAADATLDELPPELAEEIPSATVLMDQIRKLAGDEGIAGDVGDVPGIVPGPSGPGFSPNTSSLGEIGPISPTRLTQLWDDFVALQMQFTVRCKFPVCSLQGGPLQELWQNNLTVRGQLLRRMQCMNCKER